MSPEEARRNAGNMEEKGHTEKVIVDVLNSEVGGVSSASREEERRLVRKLDRRIMPMLALTYLFAGELLSFVDDLIAGSHAGRSTRQDEPRQCTTAGATTGYPARRSHWGPLRLGQQCVLLLICEYRHFQLL